MILQTFAVKDRALSAFMQPFFAPTVGLAIRTFRDAVNDKTTPMFAHPDDYDLWHLGNWNDQTGHFVQESDDLNHMPKQIMLGKQVKETA